MKAKVITLENESAGEVFLSDSIFKLPVRRDILYRMVNYQLAKRRSGTHKVKGRSEISCTGAKSVSQKGSGGARHHAKSANIFVGGGRAFGPTPRSYKHKLPKKVRTLALKIALSSKVSTGKLIIINDLSIESLKTKDLKEKLNKLGLTSVLFIGGEDIDSNFSLASRNIMKTDVMPVQGVNVYDILRRDVLVLSKVAVETLEARLK